MATSPDGNLTLERYRLNGIEETGTEIGRGSYATVVEVNYLGLRCAGKKIYRVLYEQGVGDIISRFEAECKLLSTLRHPHIVQFIGVYFEPGSNSPVLVMEFLPFTLAECLERYGVLPEEISYSLLEHVAVGLNFLHHQAPPVIHRDLSASNVLLTRDMTAKISDLGMARIINVNPTMLTQMTQGPGTLSYMPPEALGPRPRYDTKVDVFSFGVMMVHVFCGQWPLPEEAVQENPHNPDLLVALSEADRRREYLNHISPDHTLLALILQCLKNNPTRRPTAEEILHQVSHAAAQFPPSFQNRVELLRQIHEERARNQHLMTDQQQLQADKKEPLSVHHQLKAEKQQHQLMEPQSHPIKGSDCKPVAEGQQALAINEHPKELLEAERPQMLGQVVQSKGDCQSLPARRVLVLSRRWSDLTTLMSIIFYLHGNPRQKGQVIQLQFEHRPPIGVEAHKVKDLLTNDHMNSVFCNVEMLIYIFDVEGEKTEKEKAYYYSCLERIAQCSPNARIFCIIHKMDLIPEDQRDGFYDRWERTLTRNTLPLHCSCFRASVWDETFYKTWSTIVQSLISSPLLEADLRRLASHLNADEIILFEKTSVLVVAHIVRKPHDDAYRVEKISNILKQFKLSCRKLGTQFQSMEFRNSAFAAFLDTFTRSTYLMVVTSDFRVLSAYVFQSIKSASQQFKKYL